MEATWYELEQEVNHVVNADTGSQQETSKPLNTKNSNFVAVTGAKNTSNGGVPPAHQATVGSSKDLGDMAEFGMGIGAAIFVLLSIIIGALREWLIRRRLRHQSNGNGARYSPLDEAITLLPDAQA